MLVQPSRTATQCEVDLVRKRPGCAIGLRPRIPDNRWRLITQKQPTWLPPAHACAAFTRVAARTLAPSPMCDQPHRRLQPFRQSMTAPVASGWSGRRVRLSPIGKRRLRTAHAKGGRCRRARHKALLGRSRLPETQGPHGPVSRANLPTERISVLVVHCALQHILDCP